MTHDRTFRIGTRASQLARWQSNWVATRLQGDGARVSIVEIATRGDAQHHGPISDLGAPGAFTKEIQAALVARQVDLAVHSLKDLPTHGVEGLALAAVPARESPIDALVAASRAPATLASLPTGARVGAGSPRRRALLLHLRPDLELLPIRGNVDSRLRKLDEGDYDAVVLAAAGLTRLGLADRISDLLAPPRMLPAPGQGALAVECRADDSETFNLITKLDDAASRLTTTAERSLLAALEGGCSAPIAAWGRISGGQLLLDALAADAEGRRVLRENGAIDLAEYSSGAPVFAAAVELGRSVATALLALGAGELVASAKAS